ncbi:hypothetical protein PV325_009810 [Microctonus aethiopoides]|nr:hypothetical protein PV325_009810 [Microctonus aethiopoides]
MKVKAKGPKLSVRKIDMCSSEGKAESNLINFMLLLCKTPSVENSLVADRVIGKERMRKNSRGTKRNEEAEALPCMETNLIFYLPPPTQPTTAIRNELTPDVRTRA